MIIKEAFNFIESDEVREYMQNYDHALHPHKYLALITKSRASLAEKTAALNEIAGRYADYKWVEMPSKQEIKRRKRRRQDDEELAYYFDFMDKWADNSHNPRYLAEVAQTALEETKLTPHGSVFMHG